MNKLINSYQEYYRSNVLIKEYGFPPENAAIAVEAIEEKFHGQMPEIETKADGWVLVKILAGDSRHFDLPELVSSTIKFRLAKRDGIL